MSRPEATKDLCHVATPQEVCRILAGILDIPDKVHALDPCCGTGEALATVLNGRGSSYGVELDVSRARAAQGRLSRVLTSDTQEARLSRNAFGLVLLNPPYASGVHQRLEITFLERAIEWLAPGGTLIYIIKASMYNGEICRILSRNFKDFQHARFPDPFFSGPDLAYRQTVLICRKKSVPEADPEAMDQLQSTSLLLEPLVSPLGPIGIGTFAVPCGTAPATFLPGALGEDQMIDLLKTSTLKMVKPRPSDLGGVPPLPLRKGHQALVLASGLIDGVYGSGDRLHVSKGTIRRTTTLKKAIEYDDQNRPTVIFTETQGFEILVRVLGPDGVIHDVAGAKPAKGDAQLMESEEQEAA